MKKQETQALSEILWEVLKENRLDTHLYEMQVVDLWYKKFGKAAQKYMKEVFVRDKKLYVRLNSAVLKNNLMMVRSEMVGQLNEEVGREIIDEIILL